MANGPQDYRDPKVTTTGGRGSSLNWLWYVLGALLLLLLLSWLLGLFSRDEDEAAVTTEPAAVTETVTETETDTETVTVTDDAATDDAATGGAATDAATEDAATEDAAQD